MRSIDVQDEGHFVNGLAEQAEAGETITLCRAGRPVAQVIPFPKQVKRPTQEEKDAAWARLRALMEPGIDLGGFKITNRDELYDRD